MISKNEIKLIRSLHRKKGRMEAGMFIAEGLKTVMEAIESGAEPHLILLLAGEDLIQVHPALRVVSQQEMESVTALSSASPALGIFKITRPIWIPKEICHSKVIALDRIRDPGNLGTIIRSADWFGIKHVIASTDTVDCFNPKTVQSSMGSAFRVNVYYTNLPEAFRELKSQNPNFKILGAVFNGDSPTKLSAINEAAMVIGSEANGLSAEIDQCLDERLTIAKIGAAESLNAAISASILLYAWSLSPQN